MVESLLLAVTRITTMLGGRQLTCATGFYFRSDDRLYLITNRHVVYDEATNHQPDRLLIDLHPDPENLTQTSQFKLPLYAGDKRRWIQAVDSSSEVDVVAIEIDTTRFPTDAAFTCFTPEHINGNFDRVEIGETLLIPGFPLGFHDELHHLPVARQAAVASSFGLRFKGMGYFLTDGRTHRGCSGGPVVTRMLVGRHELAWRLLGVHSSRLDVTRDIEADEALGLNSAWYSDVILTLTESKAVTAKKAEDRAAPSSRK